MDEPSHDEIEADPTEVAGRLVKLVPPHLPADFPPTLVDDSWPMTGHGLVARVTGTLEAILQLRPLKRVTDGMTLARSLFDHATTFAWLAAEPGPERQRQFSRSDSSQQLKLDDDCRRLGVKVLKPELREWHEHKRAELERDMPPLVERTKGADEHWIGRAPNLYAGGEGLELHSYRGFYALMYRHHSGIAHASAHGLLFVVDELADGSTRVHLEATDDPDPLRLANALMSHTLFIAAEVLDWPSEREVAACWAPD